MGRRNVAAASLLAFACATGSLMAAPTTAEGAEFHDGWCQKDEGFAVVLYWPDKPADVTPKIPGNLDSQTLVRCIIGSHQASGDGREDAVKLAKFEYGSSGGVISTINGIESDPFADFPAYWWYHTGTFEEGSGGRWNENSNWSPNLEVNGFGVIVFSADSAKLPPTTPKFAKGGDGGDGPGTNPGPSAGPTGKPTHGPTGKPTHEPGDDDDDRGHDGDDGEGHGEGHGGGEGHGKGHGGSHQNRHPSTAPRHNDDSKDRPKPSKSRSTSHKSGKNRDHADSRLTTISTVRPTAPQPQRSDTASVSPSQPHPSSATPSSPTPSPSASSPAASAGSALAPQSSSSPVWGREDRTRRSAAKDEHAGVPWWVPVGVGVVALAGLAFAAFGHRRPRRQGWEDEE
ncbi:hypothetical protein [Cutibacterium sp.]|uniref:hypothetical protein n=1 Tax=Cutibacterium sp. TaxID=1912221 RepID=UPI0026DDC327|nr:hypothetical protein [Cutibacterium sp.]MDO4413111.1 hypothetical protein [Cutibacterium sp.]